MNFSDTIDKVVYNVDIHNDFETYVGDIEGVLKRESDLALDDLVENAK